MNVGELKNLFIFHPGGTGGNHLANLISLIPLFEPRLDHYEGDYQQAFNKEYDRFTDPLFLPVIPKQIHNVKAHFLTKHGLDGLDDLEYKEQLLSNKRINILTGHWHCFQSKDLTDFTNYAWIRMSFPEEDSLAYKRIKIFDFLPQPIDLYSDPNPFDHLALTPENLIDVETDMFFQDSGVEYLREVLKQHLEIELPAIANEMHDKWMYGLKKSLKLFPDIE